MTYTIQELAKLSNVSVRTLHHYHEIGLLVPTRNKQNQYRIYKEADLLQLQQILFFRELDFSLKDIGNIVNNPQFDMSQALKDHKRMILAKKKRLDLLLNTIDTTLNNLNNKKPMTDTELYGSFSQHEIDALAKEAKARWGNTDAYKEFENKTKGKTSEQMKALGAKGDAIFQEMVSHLEKNVDTPEVQKLIQKHYEYLHNFYTPSLEMYKGLAEMYITDERFRAYFEKFHKNLPQFVHDAMVWFVKNK